MEKEIYFFIDGISLKKGSEILFPLLLVPFVRAVPGNVSILPTVEALPCFLSLVPSILKTLLLVPRVAWLLVP